MRKQPKRSARPGVDEYGRTRLHNAVIDGDAERVAALLDQGADPNASDDAGWTPLHYAAQDQRAELVSLLLARGAEVDAVNDNGNSPLWLAIMHFRNSDAACALVRAGADPDCANRFGVTPRSLLSTERHGEVVRLISSQESPGGAG